MLSKFVCLQALRNWAQAIAVAANVDTTSALMLSIMLMGPGHSRSRQCGHDLCIDVEYNSLRFTMTPTKH